MIEINTSSQWIMRSIRGLYRFLKIFLSDIGNIGVLLIYGIKIPGSVKIATVLCTESFSPFIKRTVCL